MRPIDANRLRMRLESYVRDCEQEEDWLPAQVFMDVIAEIQDCPTIDPEDLRPHGRWLVFNNGTKEEPQQDHMACSRCGWYWSIADHSKVFSHCPNCGAKIGEEVPNG